MLEKVFYNKILSKFIKFFSDRLKFVSNLKLDMIYLFHDVLSLEVRYIREKKKLESRGAGSYFCLFGWRRVIERRFLLDARCW